MNKIILIFMMTLLALTLTACGASNASPSDSTSQANPSARTLSGPSMLAIGTLKLKGTAQEVSPEQATDLIPLWQVYQSLSTSDSAAQEEIDALAQQIEDVMTDAQLQAIVGMNLNPQDMFAVMQEMGIAMNRSSTNSNSNDSGNFMPGAGGPSPDMGAGGPPAGGMPGGGQGGGTGLSPDQIATAQAARGAGGSGGPGGGPNFVSPALLEALIQYLQEVAGA